MGWLFKRLRLSDDEMDLVIVVNPTVIRDLQPDVALWQFEDRETMLAGCRVHSGSAAPEPVDTNDAEQ